MSALAADDFPAFFKAIHGHDPFLWQMRLLKEVAETGRWPRAIAAPTGAGKTAVLDVALFHLAMEAHRGGERRAPVRICFAVDRRIIVDQAFERAKKIRDVLGAPADPVLARVAEALRAFGGAPLHVEQLRGGMPREDDWARTPAQATILCTTVDQLGSRLLFRGYGVSERMAPVHAGLLGEDCLILLDEAHLSAALAETLDNVSRWRSARDSKELAAPWGFSELTATPRGLEHRFELNQEEKSEKNIHKRLQAEKFCELSDGGALAGTGAHAEKFVEHALALAKACNRPDPVVAVIVNRVPFARAIFEVLKNAIGEPLVCPPGADSVILLTGRVRPVERDDLIKRYRHRLFAGERKVAEKSLFVVATQCVEAGADFDFDALVTQIAPLDALRQRFGRLDRLGAKSPTRSVLIAAKDEVAKSAKDDPIYGDRAKATWAWLSEHALPADKKNEGPSVDFGPNAMQALIGSDPLGASDCVAESKPAPILRCADLAFLSMTHPRPHPDPEISLFLHGELGRDTDVSIVWRADIEDCFKGPDSAEDRIERLGNILDLVPPRPGEALRIPLWQARAWLRRDQAVATAPLADVDAPTPQQERARSDGALQIARRKGGEKNTWEFVAAVQIKAGDTLIAPSSHGGCDRFGWAPESKKDVPDIADEAAEHYEGRRAFLRLHSRLWAQLGAAGVAWEEVAALLAVHEQRARPFMEALSAVLNVGPRGDADNPLTNLHMKLDRLREAESVTVERPYDAAADEGAPHIGAVLWARHGLKGELADQSGAAVTDEGDAGSFQSERLLLSVHRVDVESIARDFTRAAGFSPRLADSVALAALLHDDGKADPRFQAYLAAGAPSGEPLAKSARRPRGEDSVARSDACLPDYWRHEALSVRLAIEYLARAPRSDIDAELVVWLVGTHHGYGRPFFPHDDGWDDHARSVNGAVLAAAPGPQRLDFEWNGVDWAQLFEALKRRYGVWGLAYLEAVVRLADHRASEMRERSP